MYDDMILFALLLAFIFGPSVLFAIMESYSEHRVWTSEEVEFERQRRRGMQSNIFIDE